MITSKKATTRNWKEKRSTNETQREREYERGRKTERERVPRERCRLVVVETGHKKLSS